MVRQVRDGIPRRALLTTMPVALAMGWGRQAAIAQETSDAAFASLLAYCGVYRFADGHMTGVNRFITDARQGVLLFADYHTGAVRTLLQTSRSEFAMVLGFNPKAPAEQTVHFETNDKGVVQGLLIRAPGGADVAARKTSTRDEEISFQQDDAKLAGTLTIPQGPGPHPAILLLHGSGPSTRHSFGPYPRFFSSLGMAVLAYDKRGAGRSTGRRLDSSTGAPETLWPAYFPDDLAADALAALRLLGDRPEIDPKRIGVWGSSEGGMLATQVAARSKKVAFAINSSGFMGPLWKTILYQGAAMLRASGRPEAEIAEALAFNEFWMQVARTGKEYDTFVERRAVIARSGKTGWNFYMNGAFTSLAQMRWAWDHILTFDSLPALSRVTCPVLGLFGQADVLTEAVVASEAMRQALASGGNRDVTVKIIPNARHSLMEASTASRMAPGVFDTLRDWLVARV